MQKSILSAAVAFALMGISAMPSVEAAGVDVDFGYVTQEEGTTKLIGGYDEETGATNALNIQTSADAQKMLSEIKAALANKDLTALRKAIAQIDYEHQTAILTGTTGGGTFVDYSTDEGVISLLSFVLGSAALKTQTVAPVEDGDFTWNLQGDTHITIGDAAGASEPVLLATVGGDRVLNADLSSGQTLGAPTGDTLSVVRQGDVLVNAESGNLFLLTGGSSAINLSAVEAHALGLKYGAMAQETSATIDGTVTLNLGGHVNAAGVLGAGSAMAIAGTANSTVTGDVSVNVNSAHHKDNAVSGVVAGIVGGGSAIGTLGGTATTTVEGTTTIRIDEGTVGGVFGGGLAAAADFTDVDGLVKDVLGSIGGDGADYSDNLTFNESLLHEPGSATASSGDVLILIGGADAQGNGPSVAGVFGGGAALGYQYGDVTKGAAAESTVGTVTIQIGEEGGTNPFRDENGDIDKEAKGEFFTNLKVTLTNLVEGGLSGFGTSDVISLVNVADQPGLTALVAGGGLSLAWDRNRGTENGTDNFASVSSTVENVNMTVLSGYNVGLIGGGVAAASGRGTEDGTPMAVSDVEGDVMIKLAGGETVGVLGGGVAVFAGTREDNDGVGAQANVGSATINVVDGAMVDGIFGGGLAVDDTNPIVDGAPVETTNVLAKVDSVNIVVENASVSTLNFKAFANIEDSDMGKNDFLSYAYTAFDAAADYDVAIMAGGISASLNTADKAGAQVGTAAITLDEGAEVNGSVYGGGMGVAGGNSHVDTSTITVAGGKVDGSVYGGGLAVGEAYRGLDSNGNDYMASEADVGTANLVFASGEVTGDIVAGGVVDVQGESDASAKVGTANVTIYNGFVVGGAVRGEGADTAHLTFANGVDLTKEDKSYTTVSAFDTIAAYGGDVEGIDYDAQNQAVAIVGNGAVSIGKLTNLSDAMSVGSADAVGFVGIDNWSDASNTGTIKAVNGIVTLGASGTLGKDAYQGRNGVYVSGATDVSNLKILANSESTANGIAIGDGAELIADASGKTEVTGTVTLSENAALRFDNVGVDLGEDETSQTVTFGNSLADAATSWDNVLWTMDKSADGKTFTFKAENTLGLDGDVYGFYNGLGSDDPLRTLIDSSSYRGEESLRAGMNLAAAAGVQAAAIEGVNQGIDAASRRASLQRTYKDGVEGFAEVTGIYSKMGGSGDMNEIKLEMGGLVAGADYTTGDWTFGGLVNAGTGTVRGQGDNGGVKNEVDYYGFELYGAKRFGDFNLVGQMGYLATTNDLSDGHLGAQVDDLDADVWTVGVRGEMKHALSAKCFVVPYVGLNYLRVGTDGYTTNQGTKVDSADQNLFTMPIGAVFQGTIASASGWNWTPSVDVAYVGSFGDREVDVDTTSVTGTVGAVSMDVWSESVFRARVGLEASKGNFGIGVIAGGSAGSDDASGFFGQIRARYAF